MPEKYKRSEGKNFDKSNTCELDSIDNNLCRWPTFPPWKENNELNYHNEEDCKFGTEY